jgi:hypothetical protein
MRRSSSSPLSRDWPRRRCSPWPGFPTPAPGAKRGIGTSQPGMIARTLAEIYGLLAKISPQRSHRAPKMRGTRHNGVENTFTKPASATTSDEAKRSH